MLSLAEQRAEIPSLERTKSSGKYMTTRLITALDTGRVYQVSFWVSPAEDFGSFVADIGAHFSDTINFDTLRRGGSMLRPQIESDSTVYIVDLVNWTEIKDTFYAKGGERYMTIGRFGSGPYLRGRDFRTYYYYDDVEVANTGRSYTTPCVRVTLS